MTVLLPVLIKPGMSPAIRTMFEDHLYPAAEACGAEVVIDECPFPKIPGENFYANVAKARNHILDEHLRDEHTDVLWIDADIVDFPADLYARLRATSNAIVAPLCLIENTEPRMFYDIAGFRERYKQPMTPHYEPWFDAYGPVIDMLAVGACVVIPAEVHRKFRFEAQSPNDQFNNTDWFTLMENARGAGYRVLCDTRTIVYHAKLPDYGEEWHDGNEWNGRNP